MNENIQVTFIRDTAPESKYWPVFILSPHRLFEGDFQWQGGGGLICQ